jgi:predicted metal-binding membrane protein
VAGLAAVVLVEKLFPSGIWIARVGGLLLIALGAILLGAAA